MFTDCTASSLVQQKNYSGVKQQSYFCQATEMRDYQRPSFGISEVTMFLIQLYNFYVSLPVIFSKTSVYHFFLMKSLKHCSFFASALRVTN